MDGGRERELGWMEGGRERARMNGGREGES